jgi:hypothetical protein
VIVDEAHKIKNPTTAFSKSLQKIETKKRICLTGYPLQNNLSGMPVDMASSQRTLKSIGAWWIL